MARGRGRKPSDIWAGYVIPDRTPQPDPNDEPKPPPSIADVPEPDPWTHLEPWFPIGPFTPLSECPHEGPIRKGSDLVCMVCHAAGKDGDKALPLNVQRLPDDEPVAPRETVEPEPEPERPKETRRERRARERAEAEERGGSHVAGEQNRRAG